MIDRRPHSQRPRVALSLGMLTLGLATAVAIGCGGDEQRVTSATSVRTVTVTATPTGHETATKARRKAKKRAATLRACDANIKVKAATTTCAFAQNAFMAYWIEYDSPGTFADADGLPAYSPAANATLTVRCRGASAVRCTTRDGGYVTFSLSAVEAYSAADAERYAASHETGGVEPPGMAANGGSDDYADENLPAEDRDARSSDPTTMQENAVDDLDCADFSETDFEPIAGDPHGLDADGDGIACES